jgi:hypothetical protein
MDEKPFLEINMLDLKENQIEEVKKFHKSYFDIETILSSASELKYMGELKALISKEFLNPTPDFVKYFGKQIYEKQFTPKILEQFTYLVKRSIASHISDMISERLKAAIKDESKDPEQTEVSTAAKAAEENKVITTEDEKEAFFIIKSILRSEIDGERITFRDAQTYFAVLIDDNNRKQVCRLYFNNSENRRIAFIDEDKKETRHKLEKLDDLYGFSEQLIETANKYK